MASILRNLNVSTAGKRICGIPQVGVLASAVPSGFPFDPLLTNDIDAGHPNRLYSVEILTQPSAGTLYVYEDSSLVFSGAPDGVYTGTQRVRKYDPDTGLVSTSDTTYSFTVGAGGESSGPAQTYIRFTLQDGATLPNLSGLKWALFSQLTPNLFGAPLAQGTAETTDGAALLEIPLLASLVPVGVYWLTLTNSDGTTTQNPPARSFSCPVAVVA